MRLDLQNPLGVFPRVQSEQLNDSAAETAVNVRVGDGYCEPYRLPATIQEAGNAKTIYRVVDDQGEMWLTWPEVIDITRGQVAQDKFRRLYWTGQSGPRMIDGVMLRQQYNLGSPFSFTFPLGVTEPTESLSVASITTASRNGILRPPGSVTSTNAPADAAVWFYYSGEVPFETGQYIELVSAATEGLFYGYVERLDSNDEFVVRNANGLLYEAADMDTAYGYGSVFSYTPGISIDGVDVEQSRFYAYSFATYFGERGPLHFLEDEVFVRDGSTVTLDLPAMVIPSNVNRIQLWRTVPSAGTEDQYQLVKEIYDLANASAGPTHLQVDLFDPALTFANFGSPTTIVDNLTNFQVSQNEVAGSESFDPPRVDGHSMIALTNGITAMAADNMLLLSPPGLPHAYPALWRQALPNEIVGLSYVSNSVIIWTTADVYLATVTEPDNVLIETLDGRYGCVSKSSIATIPGYGCLAATAVGMYTAGLDGARNVTRDYINARQWQALNPASLEGEFWENKYIGFFSEPGDPDKRGFVLDFRRQDVGLVWLDQSIKALFIDPIDDNLYGIQNGQIVQWDAGEAGTGTWLSKRFDPDRDVVMEWFELEDGNGHDIELYDASGNVFHAFPVNSNRPIRTKCTRTDAIQVRITGSARWRRWKLTESAGEL